VTSIFLVEITSVAEPDHFCAVSAPDRGKNFDAAPDPSQKSDAAPGKNYYPPYPAPAPDPHKNFNVVPGKSYTTPAPTLL
jgi:hypothetical protein